MALLPLGIAACAHEEIRGILSCVPDPFAKVLQCETPFGGKYTLPYDQMNVDPRHHPILACTSKEELISLLEEVRCK